MENDLHGQWTFEHWLIVVLVLHADTDNQLQLGLGIKYFGCLAGISATGQRGGGPDNSIIMGHKLLLFMTPAY